MRRRLYATASLLCLLSLAGCATGRSATAGSGAVTGGAAGALSGPPPLSGALVTPTFGWVLTKDALLVTHDAGASFQPQRVPVPAGTARDAVFADEDNGVVAAADGTAVTVARTVDGGRTWTASTVHDPAASPAGYSKVSVSFGDPVHGAILARTATSSAFSMGTLMATVDGGRSWAARPAPEAGQLKVEPGGRTWVAGADLNMTTDQGATWDRAQIQLGDTAGTATAAVPVDGQLPVTVVDGDQTSVKLFSSIDDGHTWAAGKPVPVHAKAGPGVRVPVALARTGVIVFDSVAGHAYRALDGSDLRPSGLPAGVTDAGFATGGTAGWALATYGTCTGDKTGCVLHHELVGTTDAGASWRPVASWLEPVN